MRGGRGNRLPSRIHLQFGRVQGPEYCHHIGRCLWDSTHAVSIVIDAAGCFVDCWLVAAADPDGSFTDDVEGFPVCQTFEAIRIWVLECS